MEQNSENLKPTEGVNPKPEPTQPTEETYERTAGVRQGDPDDARYYSSVDSPNSGFGTGQGGYVGGNYSSGSPSLNSHPGYGLVPGYGAMGTQGAQGVSEGAAEHPHGPNRDEHIRQDILMRLADQPDLAKCQLEIEVVNSIVTIRGKVADLQLKRLVYATIEPMREVRDINNQIEVRDEQPKQSEAIPRENV